MTKAKIIFSIYLLFAILNIAYSLTLTNEKEALNALKDGLRGEGLNVPKIGDNWLGVNVYNFNFILKPVLTDTIDRIVVEVYFSIKPEYKYTEKLSNAIFTLNAEYNVGQYSMDSEGDLVFLTYFPFDNELDMKLLAKFLKWLDKLLYLMLGGSKSGVVEMLE